MDKYFGPQGVHIREVPLYTLFHNVWRQVTCRLNGGLSDYDSIWLQSMKAQQHKMDEAGEWDLTTEAERL